MSLAELEELVLGVEVKSKRGVLSIGRASSGARELRPLFLFGMRLKRCAAAERSVAGKRGLPVRGSLLWLSRVKAAVGLASGVGSVGLETLFSVSPGSRRSISGGLEPGGLVKGSEDRSIALGLAVRIVATRGSRLRKRVVR